MRKSEPGGGGGLLYKKKRKTSVVRMSDRAVTHVRLVREKNCSMGGGRSIGEDGEIEWGVYATVEGFLR